MRREILLLAVLPLLLTPTACGPQLETARVARAIDGDTIVLDTGQTVRYIGIDAPEMHPDSEPYGWEAWAANRELVEGKEVILERDASGTDEYGRLLRYVYVNKIFVNGELVRRGLAEAKAYPPDTKYLEYLGGLEGVAREAGRGMWAK